MKCFVITKHFPNNKTKDDAFHVNNTSTIYHRGGRLKYQKNRRGTGPPTEVSACGACEAAELAPGGVGEVLVELLGEVPGEVLALPPRSCRRRQQ